MTLPLEHTKERLSVAYVSAVVARAGAAFTEIKADDFGVDAHVQRIVELPNGKFHATGWILQCQIKATTTSELENDSVIYDMKADAYNKLVTHEGTPCVLLLLCLPKNHDDWLHLDEDQLLLKRCCYWIYLAGQPSTNASTHRIRIPRNQVFTPSSVEELLEKVKQGGF